MAHLAYAATTQSLLPGSPPEESSLNNDRSKATTTRQRYIAVACDFCKKRHSRCDAVQPRCGLCTRYNESCTYLTEMHKKGRKRSSSSANAADQQSLEVRATVTPSGAGSAMRGGGGGGGGGEGGDGGGGSGGGGASPPLGMALVHSLGQQVPMFERKTLSEVYNITLSYISLHAVCRRFLSLPLFWCFVCGGTAKSK